MSIVTVENVSHSFGGRQILENVSFRLLSGEHVGLVGANGEGKSTFLNILTGKLVPEEGRVAWCRRITRGYLDQHTVLEKGKSIRQVLQDAFSHLFELEAEMLQKYEEMGDCSEERMNELLQDVGEIQDILEHSGFYMIDARIQEVAQGLGLLDIGLEKDVTMLSGGQRSKVLLCKLLLENPMILILDEPTSGLDPLMQNAFVELIQEEKQRGKTILMSSHMFEEVEKTCDRIGIIRQGHMAAIEDTVILQKNKTKTYILTFADSSQTQRFLQERLQMKQISELCVHVYVREDLKVLLQLLPAYELRDLNVATQSLEDIFLQYYGEKGEAHE